MERLESGSAKKARLRAQFREARTALSPQALARQSAALIPHLDALVVSRGARIVSAFWPLATEPDLRTWIEALHARGVTVALPVVVSEKGDPPRLEHRRFTAAATLVPGRFGVMEPLAEDRIAPEAVEVAVVPALAVDRGGARLGYGGGFYDSYLALSPALRVAALFASGVAESVPSEPHDVRLDALVTSVGVIWTGARGR